jgi:hypothetical protein
VLGCSVPGVLLDFDVKRIYLEDVVNLRSKYG